MLGRITSNPVQSLFGRAREPVEVAPDMRSKGQIAETFQAFLATKYQFTVKDRLQYRHIEFIDAKGFAKVVAFFKFGGLAALGSLLMGQKLTEERKTDLRNQCQFYRALCLATDKFRAFSKGKEGDVKSFESAQKAFEDLLEGQADLLDPAAYRDIAHIINRQARAPVADRLVEAHAHLELTKNGSKKMSEKTTFETFESQSFLEFIDELYDKGYRLSTAVDTANEVYQDKVTGNPAFDRLMENEEMKPFYMAYARAYNKLYNAGTEREQERSAFAHAMVVRSLTLDPDQDALGVAVRKSNEDVFKKIAGNAFNPELPVGITKVQYNELYGMYIDYNDVLAAVTQSALDEDAKRTTAYEAVDARNLYVRGEESYTYEQLENFYSSRVEEQQEGAGVYNALKAKFTAKQEEVAALQRQIEERDGAIQQRMRELQDSLIVLTPQAEELTRQIAELEASRKASAKGVVIDASRPIDIDTMQRHNASLTEQRERTRELEGISQRIREQEAELVSLVHHTHQLWVEHNDLDRQKNEAMQYTQVMTRAQLFECAPYTPDERAKGVRSEVVRKDAEVKRLEGEADASKAAHKEHVNRLEAIADKSEKNGFIFQGSNIVGLDYVPFRESGNLEALVERLKEIASLTRLFITQTRLVGMSYKELNKVQALDDRSVSRSDQIPVSSYPVSAAEGLMSDKGKEEMNA